MRNAIYGVAKLLILLLVGCRPADTPSAAGTPSTDVAHLVSASVATASAPAPSASTATAPLSVEQALEQRAASFIDRAARLEPNITPLLTELAERFHGEMYKLEYRLKTPKSTLRKLRKLHAGNPDLAIEALSIDDSLRYTMKLADQPPGRYVEAVTAVLAALGEAGFEVVTVKNYWPKGDGYSGINTALRDASGLQWELQFHTPASIRAQLATRAQYEELRKVATPVKRKRELFDTMAQTWDAVPLPREVLVPGKIHDREQILQRPRP